MTFQRHIALILTLAASVACVPIVHAADDGAALNGWNAAAGPAVSEQLAPGAIRYFADGPAKQQAHPSYALVAEPKEATPVGAGGSSPTPLFGTIGGKQAVRVVITPGTSLYGTGEAAGPLLRNGRQIVAWNTDAYGYGDEAKSLYQTHPWVLAVRPDGTAFGVLADTTYRCTIDTAYTSPNEIQFIADGPAFGAIIIDKPTPQAVLTTLADLTGKMPMPPKWAIGYHQCRYSYFPDSRVREIAEGFRSRQIPCDIIWFDIDYMEAFRIFTFDRGHFPDPKKLNSDLHNKGFHTVWMIDPGMKSRDDRGPADRKAEDLAKEPAAAQEARAKEIANYKAIMDSGTKADVWVKRADGKVYEGEVWPGWCNFPDFTDPAVRAWWAGLYKDFVALGVDGVWNDMNEPAVFNVASKTMPEDNRHRGDPSMIGPSGKPQGDAAADKHARYHNVYGMQMIRGTREGIAAAVPDKRPFVLSRANYIGGQRYGATWTGDNSANWYHLETSIPMSLNVGLSGQPFIGPDIGGFAGNGDGKLFARWMGFGSLFPFSRGHTAKENINKEPWAFGPAVEATCKEALQRRYRLIPYLYTLFHEASVNGQPIARPLFFADPTDPALRSEDDAFLLGDAVLVKASVVPDGSRVSAMPKGAWRAFATSADKDLPNLLLKPGAILPTGPDMQYVDEKPLDPLTLIVNLDPAGKATGTLYEDAGNGYGYQKGEYLLTTYEAVQEGGTITVKVAKTEGQMARPKRACNVKVIFDNQSVLTGQGTDGQPISIKVPG
ncbi:MAG: DUF5110 domain-containing protein [Planctomycetes bacterium]|nr:DUF5110 domain-containing protein [Planctomycetota bacterium]